mgnify:FL=1
MTPLEEQLEKLARKWEKDADVLEGLAPKGTWVNGASTARREDANQLRALLPLEVTDESVNVPKAALAQVMAIVRLTYPVRPESLAAEAIRQCNAALTQKGEPRACTGCANGCAGCKGKGKPYGEELMRQLRQGQKGDNE